jgi:hypothetical protein
VLESWPVLNGQKLTRDERPVRAELAVLGYGFLDEPRRPVEAGKKMPLQAGACMSV